jgi:hypothetical protein
MPPVKKKGPRLSPRTLASLDDARPFALAFRLVAATTTASGFDRTGDEALDFFCGDLPLAAAFFGAAFAAEASFATAGAFAAFAGAMRSKPPRQSGSAAAWNKMCCELDSECGSDQMPGDSDAKPQMSKL